MIYILISRLGSSLISPFGFIFIFLIIQLFLNKRIISLFSILLMWTFSMPITSILLWKRIEYPWVRIQLDEVEKAKAIVVLSGGSVSLIGNNNDLIEWKDFDRFNGGINLFKNNKAPLIIFTNGNNNYKNKVYLEGDIYKNEAIKLGVPYTSIYKTGKVINTLNESKIIRNSFSHLLNSDNKIILVTSAFHMKRAKVIFERNNFNVIPYPVDFKVDYSKSIKYKKLINYLPNPKSFIDTSAVFREYLGRIIYRTI